MKRLFDEPANCVGLAAAVLTFVYAEVVFVMRAPADLMSGVWLWPITLGLAAAGAAAGVMLASAWTLHTAAPTTLGPEPVTRFDIQPPESDWGAPSAYATAARFGGRRLLRRMELAAWALGGERASAGCVGLGVYDGDELFGALARPLGGESWSLSVVDPRCLGRSRTWPDGEAEDPMPEPWAFTGAVIFEETDQGTVRPAFTELYAVGSPLMRRLLEETWEQVAQALGLPTEMTQIDLTLASSAGVPTWQVLIQVPIDDDRLADTGVCSTIAEALSWLRMPVSVTVCDSLVDGSESAR